MLCTHREDVTVINERALRLHFAADQIIELAPRHTAVEMPELDAWATDPSFHRLSCIAIGAPVVFTANTDVAQDAANGCTGTIVGVRRYRARISTVRVRLDDNDHEIDVHRRTIHRTWLRGQEYRRETFPLELAYAITAHKAQGATLRSLTVVHPRRVFCPGQLYVMLSRVTDRAMLRLTRLPSPEEFVPLMLGAP